MGKFPKTMLVFHAVGSDCWSVRAMIMKTCQKGILSLHQFWFWDDVQRCTLAQVWGGLSESEPLFCDLCAYILSCCIIFVHGCRTQALIHRQMGRLWLWVCACVSKTVWRQREWDLFVVIFEEALSSLFVCSRHQDIIAQCSNRKFVSNRWLQSLTNI